MSCGRGKLEAMTRPAATRPSDAIVLTGLRVRANHGVYDFERENGQDFVVDVTAWLDLAAPAASDDVAHTVHYGELAEEIADAVRRDPVDLIETVAERVAGVVLAHPPVDAVEVTVHKPDAPISVPFGDVAVRILRERS
jgi:dihydroneopterin aldolase/dihydroneopterin aldolase/2-amino-4-hydroxy-6-hydroxymethyldihydropteridine diphosphokinase